MNTMYKLTASLLVVLAAAGCATVTSERDDPQAKGYRYYLPQPYLYVTPGEDGQSVTVKPVLLPDYKRGYVLDAQTFLAQQAVTVKVERGLLQSVNSESNATLVAQKAIGAGAEVASAVIAKQQAEAAAGEAADPVAQLQKIIEVARALGLAPPAATPEANFISRTDTLEPLDTMLAIIGPLLDSKESSNPPQEKLKEEFKSLQGAVKLLKDPISTAVSARARLVTLVDVYDRTLRLGEELVRQGVLKGDNLTRFQQAAQKMLPDIVVARKALLLRERPQLLRVDSSKEHLQLVPLQAQKGNTNSTVENVNEVQVLPAPKPNTPKEPDKIIQLNVEGLDINLKTESD